MSGFRARLRKDTLECLGWVVRRVPIGEADWLATFFTRDRGLVPAMARGARRPSSKLGPIEPLHTLRLWLDYDARSEVATLRETRIEVPRIRILDRPEAFDAATVLLAWVRDVVPSWSPEPSVFDRASAALDGLDQREPTLTPQQLLCTAGIALLDGLGYGLETDACTRCGKPCPGASSAFIDPARGGVVCRACGGAGTLAPGLVRALLAGRLPPEQASPAQLAAALEIVTRALSSHAPRAQARTK